ATGGQVLLEDPLGFRLGDEQQERVRRVVGPDVEQWRLHHPVTEVHLHLYAAVAARQQGVGDAEPDQHLRGRRAQRQRSAPWTYVQEIAAETGAHLGITLGANALARAVMARVDPHVSRMAVKVRVLGSFEVVADGRCATPTAPKLRQTLALLVLEHNKIVPTHALIDELWGEAPPRQATRTVHTYIYEIRRGLRAFADADRTLVTHPNGYMAAIRPEDLDVTTFESAVRDASGALAGHEPDRARQLLGDALALWRERPLSNVRCGRILDAFVARLDESWLRAVELRIDADFQLNRHHDLVGELKALSAANRFHEGVHEKLMLALYRCGRRNEALEVYRRLHHRLAEELGLSPGSQVQRLQQLMLFADPVLDPPGVPRRSSVAAPPPAPPPQLPPGIPRLPRPPSPPPPPPAP